MRQSVLPILASGLVLLALGCAAKPNTAANVDKVFIQYDNDRNGIITKEEFSSHWVDKQRADTAWKKLDAEGRGSLSRSQAADVPFDVWSELESQSEP
jgi:hypothetical protein